MIAASHDFLSIGYLLLAHPTPCLGNAGSMRDSEGESQAQKTIKTNEEGLYYKSSKNSTETKQLVRKPLYEFKSQARRNTFFFEKFYETAKNPLIFTNNLFTYIYPLSYCPVKSNIVRNRRFIMGTAKKKTPEETKTQKSRLVAEKPAPTTRRGEASTSHATHTHTASKNGATKIVAHFDCGFPNTLFIRGEGISTLNWDKGSPMKNVGANEWVWESDRPFSTMQFKLLINDSWYEQGNNHSIAYGQTVDFSPKF